MSQLAQPTWLGMGDSSRGEVSNVSLSPTTENRRVTIALEGAGPSLSFRDDLVVGRRFQEARFELSVHESVFSNVALSKTIHVGALPRANELVAGFGLQIVCDPVDKGSPSTEVFHFNQHANFDARDETVFAVDEVSLRALEAAEQECEEDLQEELRRERGLWKYART